jgi:hypothetical protein
LHPHALTFCQPAQPAALKGRRMNENILPAVTSLTDSKTGKTITATSYALKCTPAQRMF